MEEERKNGEGARAELAEIIERSRPFIRHMSYYRCAMMTIETKCNVLNEEFSLLHDRNPIVSIKSRLKSPVSIQNKLSKLGAPFHMASMVENIHDIAGVRVVCSFVDDVYMLADALLRQNDVTLITKKDYIASPKANGYRSLHLIVSVPVFLANETRSVEVELQLRTLAMDTWANLEHQLRYKKNVLFSSKMADELIRCADLSVELDRRMGNLQKQLSEAEDS